jgi:NAD(P)-dependent dehydrogenase (short-subunit alcohol dehydrogenase family)
MAFEGKVVIVTGAAGGLGFAIAKELLSQQATVVITDILEPRLEEARKSISDGQQNKFLALNVDGTDSTAVEKLFGTVVEKFGKVDVLVNNAGIADRFHPVGDVPREVWDKVININLTAPMITSQFAVQQMLKQEAGVGGIKGVILNVASAASSKGFCAGMCNGSGHTGQTVPVLTSLCFFYLVYNIKSGVAYTSSKHGLVGLTKNTASYYGLKGIRCIAILPGGMGDTNIADMFKEGGIHQEGMDHAMKTIQTGYAFATIAEVGKTVASLCSDTFVLVNGACIPVDNGWAA